MSFASPGPSILFAATARTRARCEGSRVARTCVSKTLLFADVVHSVATEQRGDTARYRTRPRIFPMRKSLESSRTRLIALCPLVRQTTFALAPRLNAAVLGQSTRDRTGRSLWRECRPIARG